MTRRSVSIAEIERAHPPFITVIKDNGWRPVMVVWNDENGFSAIEQSWFACHDKSDAVIVAQEWARGEALEYRD